MAKRATIWWDEKEVIRWITRYFYYSCDRESNFELMITDELVEIVVEKTNLYFQQNIVGKIFKKSSHITRYLEESKHARLFNQNDIFLYIATLVYRGVVHQPIPYALYE